MRELDPGHCYLLDNLKGEGCTQLQFYRDPELHFSGCHGPSTQEVIRACIARIKYLDTELHWWGNRWIILFLRSAIFLCELRALLRKSQKAGGIENLRTRKDGHVY